MFKEGRFWFDTVKVILIIGVIAFFATLFTREDAVSQEQCMTQEIIKKDVGTKYAPVNPYVELKHTFSNGRTVLVFNGDGQQTRLLIWFDDKGCYSTHGVMLPENFNNFLELLELETLPEKEYLNEEAT